MHCPLSSPTPELLDGFRDFDFYRFLTTFSLWGIIRQHISDVFDWLKVHVCTNYLFDNHILIQKLCSHKKLLLEKTCIPIILLLWMSI